jgi:esterase
MQLAFQAVGNGFPLLILHGLFGSADNWRTFSLQLGQQFATYAIDLRNHGRSPWCPTDTYREMAMDIYDFIQQQQLAKVVILGHSMGGKVAMTFAQMYPHLLERLIVSDISPRQNPIKHSREMDALNSIDLSTVDSRKAVESALMERLHDNGTVQFFLKGLYRADDGSFHWRFNVMVLTEQYHNILAATLQPEPLSLPALFVRGERSNYIQPEDEELIRSQYLNAEIITIPQAGHWIHADQPALFAQTIQHYLQDLA